MFLKRVILRCAFKFYPMILCYGMVWYSMVWYGMESMLCYDMICMLCYDMIYVVKDQHSANVTIPIM